MNDRLRKLMDALSLLAKKSNEPDALMIMELRIHEYFAGVADRQAVLESLRKAMLAEAEAEPDDHEFWEAVEKVRRSNSLIAPRACIGTAFGC